jgi:hypothetical protein
LLGVFEAGQDVDRDTGARERRRKCVHIHVHAAGVAAPRNCTLGG